MPDQYKMADLLERFQEQIIEGYNLGANVNIDGNFTRIVFCGMGGSALGGRIIKSYIGNKTPVFVVDDYMLPEFVGKESLVFAVSYSGDTEETLEACSQAIKNKITPVIITSAGRLEILGLDNGFPIIKLPGGLQPRMSYGYQLFSILRILDNLHIVKDTKAITENAAVFIGKEKEKIKAHAREISKKLVGKIPLIYSSKNFEAAAYKWKKNFNENAKTMAFTSVFPEHNHNELNGFIRANGNFHIIFIRDKGDHPRVRKRIDVAKKIAEENMIESTVVEAQGNNFLERILSTIYLGDWASYYLALEYGVDPTPVELIQKFKSML